MFLVGVGLGDDASDGIKQLQAQINRYTGFRDPVSLPVTGILDAETAKRALTIGVMRGSESEDASTVVRYSSGLASNPVAFVNANLGELVQVVKIYADTHGLPPAKDVASADLGSPLFIAGIAAIAVVGAMYLFGQKRSR